MSPRIAAAVTQALDLLSESPDLCQEADFWSTPDRNHAPIVRDRSAAPASLQKLAMIAPSEIRAAIALAHRQNGGMSEDELPGAVASLLGLPKPTTGLRALVRSLTA